MMQTKLHFLVDLCKRKLTIVIISQKVWRHGRPYSIWIRLLFWQLKALGKVWQVSADKQLKFKSHKQLQVEFISNNIDVMTCAYLSSVALASHHYCQDGLSTQAQTNFNQCLLDTSHNHLCIYKTKTQLQSKNLFILGQIFEWMYHIVTSAHQWVNIGCQC